MHTSCKFGEIPPSGSQNILFINLTDARTHTLTHGLKTQNMHDAFTIYGAVTHNHNTRTLFYEQFISRRQMVI